MNLHKTDTKERIINAAAQLFARQGYSGTCTREIARFSHITEATLFHHFPRKQDLFWAALQGRLQRIEARKELWKALNEPGDPDVVIPLVVELLVHLATYHRDLIRLFLVGFIEMRPGTERIYRREVAPIIEAIQNYLARTVKCEDMDASSTTLTLASGIVASEFLGSLLGSVSYANTEAAIVAHSRHWLNLLAPASTNAGSKTVVLDVKKKKTPSRLSSADVYRQEPNFFAAYPETK
jgi:AcrR family transcriptional regulator